MAVRRITAAGPIAAVLLALAVGCGGAAGEPSVPAAIETSAPTTSVPAPSATAAADDPALHASTVARATADVAVYAAPGAPAPRRSSRPRRSSARPGPCSCVADEGEWLEVALPVRPNGSTGWVRRDGLELRTVDEAVLVDTTTRDPHPARCRRPVLTHARRRRHPRRPRRRPAPSSSSTSSTPATRRPLRAVRLRAVGPLGHADRVRRRRRAGRHPRHRRPGQHRPGGVARLRAGARRRRPAPRRHRQPGDAGRRLVRERRSGPRAREGWRHVLRCGAVDRHGDDDTTTPDEGVAAARAADAALVDAARSGDERAFGRAVRPVVRPGVRRRLAHPARPGHRGRGGAGRLPRRLAAPR